MNGNVTYHQQVSYCGKTRCRKCRDGVGHGPYWYAYQTENGRTTRTYIGKNLPVEIQQQREEAQKLRPAELNSVILRISVLGQFRIERKEGEYWKPLVSESWQHHRVRALLACLLSSHGRKLGREQLMEALWPELDMETSSNRLDRTVHSVRHLLEPNLSRPATSRLLRIERDGLVLADKTSIWVDAEAFEHLVARVSATSDPQEAEKLLEDAAALYEGDFVPEEQTVDIIIAHREILQRYWMGTLLELVDLRLAHRAYGSAIGPLDRLLDVDPANEAAVQRLIIALALLDRRGEALRAYHRLADKLQQNYSMVPLPETRKLYHAVQQGDIQAPAALSLPSQTVMKTLLANERNQTRTLEVKVQIGRSHQTPLIGRTDELEIIQRMLDTTRKSTQVHSPSRKRLSILQEEALRQPQCVMLAGDSGLGKTRLAEEVSREAQKHAWVIAWSRVYAQENSIPYRAWAEILRNTLTNGLWQKSEVSKYPFLYQPLSLLLPELQNVFSPLDIAVPLSPEQEQLRLWEATLELLTTISERTPLLIVLDDFHWADGSSYELFAYLVRRLHSRAIAFIATYRETELPAKHPLHPLLIDLEREKVVLSLPLAPLTDEQIAALVAHLPEPVVQHIQTQAAGNPFFAEELARVSPDLLAEHIFSGSSALPTQTYVLPNTIASVLTLRIERLSTECQHLLNTLAVLGGSFDFQMVSLLETSGRTSGSEDSILDRIEEAITSGLLIEEGSGTHIRYTFWHPLLVKHLYESLSAARCASLHRRIANVLQQIYAGREAEGAATITTHLVAGGADSQQIAHYAELAADSAYILSAYPEADHYYSLAIEYRDPPLNLEPDQRLHTAYLLERRAECTRVQGNYADARSLYERVLSIRNLQGTHVENQYQAQIDALLWCEIGRTWYDLGNNEQARQCYEQGKQVLQSVNIEGGPAWAMLHFHQSYSYWREGSYEAAFNEASESLRLFEDTLQQSEQHTTDNITALTSTARALAGDQVNLGRTHVLLGLIAATEGQPGTALAHLNAALTVFELYNYQREVANVSCDIGDVYLRKSEHELAQAFFRRSLHLAEQVGDTPLRSVIFGSLGELATRLGNLVEAEKWFKQGITLAEQINEQIYINILDVYLASVLQHQNKIAEAKACIHKALLLGRSVHNLPCIGLALIALGGIRIGQAIMLQNISSSVDTNKRKRYLLNAQRNIERALSLEELEAETRNEGQLVLAKAFFLQGKLERAQQLALSAIEDALQYELISIQAQAQCLLGSIRAAQDKPEEAQMQFEAAIAIFQKYEMRLEYARTLYSYGIAIVRQKRVQKKRYAEGIGYLQKALEILEQCSAKLDVQFVKRVLKEMQVQ